MRKKVFAQDLSQNETNSHLFFMWLLFDKEPVRPDTKTIHEAVKQKFGKVDVAAQADGMSAFAVHKYISEFSDAKIPTQLVMGDVHPFGQEQITEFERGQLWDCNNGNELLGSITHKVPIWDMMDTLDYIPKTEMLMDWLEAAVEVFPDCVAVWIPSAGKLIMADRIRSQSCSREDRYIHYCVNVRFFNIDGSDAMIVDTRGMYAMNLPDIQCHFHSMDPNHVVNYVYNIALYLFKNRMPIKDGDTIDGLRDGRFVPEIQWVCRHEGSLIQPFRPVIDVCPGEFAGGGRE